MTTWLDVGVHAQGLDFDLPSLLAHRWLTYTILRDDRELIRPIWQVFPGARFHLRWLSWITDDSPEGRARDAAQAANEIMDACPGIDLWVSGINEQSIEGGGSKESDFIRCAEWHRRFRVEFRKTCTRAKLLYSGESPGHQEDGPTGVVGYLVMEAEMRLWDGFAAHLYTTQPEDQSPYWHRLRIFRRPDFSLETEGRPGDPGGLYWITRDWRRPDGTQYPILITETNCTDVLAPDAITNTRRWLGEVVTEDVDHRIDGADWFPWTSPDPHFATMQLAQRQALIDAWADTPYPEAPRMPIFKLGFLTLANKLLAEGHTVTADEDEISIAGLSAQKVSIDGRPNAFVWRDGQESVTAYPLA